MSVDFRIRLAGQIIAISACFPYVKEYCRNYLTAEEPDFSVCVSSEDIVFEREKSAREDQLEGRAVRHFPNEYLETLAVYRKIAVKLLDNDILLFHGSAVAVDGVGYLFTARSGTGKSTHTKLWREMFGERAVMVNDDKPLLRIAENGVTVYGTPWDGKHRLSTNLAVPLKAICILERGRENQIAPITKRDAWPMLMQQSYRPDDAAAMIKTMTLVDRLASAVPIYRLICNMEPEAAETAYLAMNPEAEETTNKAMSPAADTVYVAMNPKTAERTK